MDLREIVLNVQETGVSQLIPCKDIKNQNSLRTQLYRKIKSYGKDASITICNCTHENQLFVKVYIKADIISYTIEDGKLVLARTKGKSMNKTSNIRQVSLMREDGLSDEEIEEALK